MEFITKVEFFIDLGFLMDMTFTFTVTAVLILVAKFLFRDKFTPRWHVLVWIVLMVRLILPVFPESNFSVFNFMPAASETYTSYVETQTRRNGQIVGADAEITVSKQEQEQQVVEETTILQSPEQDRFVLLENMILSLYFAGVLGMAISLAFSYRRVLRELKKLPKCERQQILNAFEQMKAQVGIQGQHLELKTGVESPILLGIFKPTIYLSETYDGEELSYIFAHELCHYKNGDILWNLVSAACLCLNWFNPLAWIAIKVFRRDLEVYCDYRATKLLGRKREYAEILLKTATNKKSFLVASTCLENGEKEVSVRIKKLVNFKEPKLWMSIAGVILVVILSALCLTDRGDKEEGVETIDIMGPQNQWSEYMVDIPSKWAKSSVAVRPEEEWNFEKRVFYDKDGNETITLDYRLWNEESDLNEGDGTKRLAQKVAELANKEEERKLPDGSEVQYILSGPSMVTTSGIYAMYEVQYCNNAEEGSDADKRDGVVDKKEVVKQGLYLPLAEDCILVPVLYTNNPELVSIEDLIGIAKTITKAENPEEYRPTATAQMLTEPEKGIGIQGGDYDAEKLLEDYLQNYVDTKLPIMRDIKGYKINSMEQIEAVGDIPGFIDEGMIEGETAPWDIIYPSARVYKVDYELIPETVGKYGDFAGGGFDETEDGNKRYTEAYGVFYGYSVDGKNFQATFLGFVHTGTLAEYKVDYSVMSALDQWYDQVVWPQVLKNAKVKYIGDASAVGKLAGLLPLHEYRNGMELFTTEEPYEIMLHYKIGRDDDQIIVHLVTGETEVKSNKENNGHLVAWPALNGNISGIRSKVKEGNKVNQYIEKRIWDNARKLVEGTEYTGLAAMMDYKSPYTEPYTIGFSKPEKNKQ